MNNVAMFSLELNILTINVWGIPFVSHDRKARIDAIGDELATGKYDIVSLQEVWSQADSLTLREKTENVLPHSHYFHSGVFGAGLLVLSKYPIIGSLFHAWSVNGYCHRVQHGDWFGGKGVGLCKILIGDQIVHLYNAHLHAEYDKTDDEYKTHRAIQAFDTAQFIEATRGNAVLQILAGDLNTEPDDISYKVLLYTSKMSDCCKSRVMATNECQRNSYTSKRSLLKNPIGIRIDHIFVRGADHVEAYVVDCLLPLPEYVPGKKFSFSDHEAVMAIIKLVIQEPKDSANCNARTDDTCPAPSNYNHKVITDSNYLNGGVKTAVHEAPIGQRIAVLRESVALCDVSLKHLKIDRIVYYSVALLLMLFLAALVEYTSQVPHGFKTLYLLVKFLVFGVTLFSIFMASMWNAIERNGILSGKLAMEIIIRNFEKFQL